VAPLGSKNSAILGGLIAVEAIKSMGFHSGISQCRILGRGSNCGCDGMQGR
jgi:hypothetical protein